MRSWEIYHQLIIRECLECRYQIWPSGLCLLRNLKLRWINLRSVQLGSPIAVPTRMHELSVWHVMRDRVTPENTYDSCLQSFVPIASNSKPIVVRWQIISSGKHIGLIENVHSGFIIMHVCRWNMQWNMLFCLVCY